MPNPLAGGLPPIPNPRPQSGSSNALAAPPPQSQMPAPNHQQTVAAIRHFSRIIGELKTLGKNPALGKSDIKSEIIDSITGLVSERMLSAGQAVIELEGVPRDPIGQRKWVMGMLQQNIAAQNNVLDHHVAAHPGTLDWARESVQQPGSTDDHIRTMDGLMSQYPPRA